jgi:hypothetical protein
MQRAETILTWSLSRAGPFPGRAFLRVGPDPLLQFPFQHRSSSLSIRDASSGHGRERHAYLGSARGRATSRLSWHACAGGTEVESEPRWCGISRTLSPFLAIWSFPGDTER